MASIVWVDELVSATVELAKLSWIIIGEELFLELKKKLIKKLKQFKKQLSKTKKLSFYFEKYLPADRMALSGRDGLRKLRVVLAKLKNIASPVERGFWLKELSVRTGVAESPVT